MSSGNPDRARRDRKSVDYTTKSLDAEMRDAFDEAYGDKSTLDVAGAPTELDINESRAVDKTFRSSRNVDSDDSDDYDSDDLAEDDDGNPVRLARKKKKEKSEAEVAAEQAVAQGLNLSYPEGFKQTRKGLRYAAMACSVGSKRQGVRYALNRVIVDDALTPADRELVINMADEIGRTIRVPNQYLADTFEPLSNFNGGIYTKTGQNMGMLSAIAMGVHMAAELPEFRANGSAQAQGFAAVLGVAGLGGDIVSMLTDQHTDETPEQSARNGARKIVEQLNALTDADLVASLYHNIANFPQRARTMMAGRELKHEYDYTHFDSTKPKGWTDISQKKAVVSVGLTLLHRTSPADSYSKHLASHYGADSAPDAAGYKPCYSFPDSKFVPTQTQLDSVGSQAWINVRDNEPDEVKAARRALDAFRADPGDEQSEALGYHEFAKRVHKLARVFEDVRKKAVNVERRKLLATEEAAYYKKCEELGEYVETHRAQVDITPFTRSMTGGRAEVVGALKSMLLSTKSEDKETAPKLKDYLSSLPRLLATRRDKDGDGLDPLFSNYWGNFQGAYLGIKANGVTCRLGRKAERNRTIHTTHQGGLHLGVAKKHKETQLQNFLKLDGDVTSACLREFIQPWKLTGPGTIEFCLLLTNSPPEDFISLHEPRDDAYDIQSYLAGGRAIASAEHQQSISEYKQACYAKMHKGRNPDGIEKKRLKPDEKDGLQALTDQARTKAETEWKEAHPYHKRDAFHMNYPIKYLRLQTAGDTSAKRKQVRDDAKVTKQAKENHKRVVAANPDLGGSDIQNTTGFGRD